MVASLAFRPHPPQKAQFNRHHSALQRSPIMVLPRIVMGTYRPASQVNSCAEVGVASLDNAANKTKKRIASRARRLIGVRQVAGL